MTIQEKKIVRKKHISTIDWLCYHCDKTTGEPFLSDAHHYVAEKFAILCEKMISTYRMSRWDSFVDRGHYESYKPIGDTRKILYKILKTLGEDAPLTADIVIKNYSLPMAEKKHKISRGRAKIILRTALDRLVDLFGLKAGYRRSFC